MLRNSPSHSRKNNHKFERSKTKHDHEQGTKKVDTKKMFKTIPSRMICIRAISQVQYYLQGAENTIHLMCDQHFTIVDHFCGCEPNPSNTAGTIRLQIYKFSVQSVPQNSSKNGNGMTKQDCMVI